jgi:hypothetical protein
MNYLAHELKILGKKWTVYYCTSRYYKKKCGDDSVGLTECDLKEIYLLIKRLTPEIAAHELFHAYMVELCVTPASLTPDQMEEICADVIGKHGRKLLKQADQIIDAYHVLRGRVEGSN